MGNSHLLLPESAFFWEVQNKDLSVRILVWMCNQHWWALISQLTRFISQSLACSLRPVMLRVALWSAHIKAKHFDWFGGKSKSICTRVLKSQLSPQAQELVTFPWCWIDILTCKVRLKMRPWEGVELGEKRVMLSFPLSPFNNSQTICEIGVDWAMSLLNCASHEMSVSTTCLWATWWLTLPVPACKFWH